MNSPVNEFLERVEVCGAGWCVVDLGVDNGFRLPRSQFVHVHLVIEGTAQLTDTSDQPLQLAGGDVAIQVSGDSHQVCCGTRGASRVLKELSALPCDLPLFAKMGDCPHACRLLSGRLEILWPGEHPLARPPKTLVLKSGDIGIDVPKLFRTATTAGATAALNRAAGLLLISALRADARIRVCIAHHRRDPSFGA